MSATYFTEFPHEPALNDRTSDCDALEICVIFAAQKISVFLHSCDTRKPSGFRHSGAKMPKMKSNSGAKKRFTVTASGKLKRKKAFHSHILTKKSPKRKRNLRESTVVDRADEPRMKRMIGG